MKRGRNADIKKLCDALSEHYGEKVTYESKGFWLNENSQTSKYSTDFDFPYVDITNNVENYHDLGGRPYPSHIIRLIDKVYKRKRVIE